MTSLPVMLSVGASLASLGVSVYTHHHSRHALKLLRHLVGYSSGMRYFNDSEGGLFRERDPDQREILNGDDWFTFWFNAADVREIDEAEARAMAPHIDLKADPKGESALRP